MSVSSSSNFLRERHRTTHCYLSGIHIIYRTQAWYLQDSSWDHQSQSLAGPFLKYLCFHAERKGLHTFTSVLYQTPLFCIDFSPQQCCDLSLLKDLYVDSHLPYCPIPPVCFCNRPILRNCPQATSGQLTSVKHKMAFL